MGHIALKQFFINHKMLSDMGERTVLHDLNIGVYGKPGESKYSYVSAWLKDMEYERALDYADEANDLVRAANKAAEDANTLACRALLTARISAATAVIALIAAMMTKTM